MEELLNQIKRVVRDETTEVIKKETAKIVRDETKKIVKKETAEIKNRLANVETRMDNIEKDTAALRKAMFVVENDYFNKIDTMYDYILFQKEMNDIKFKDIEKMGKKVEYNELKILNHDTRIEVLENNLSQSV